LILRFLASFDRTDPDFHDCFGYEFRQFWTTTIGNPTAAQSSATPKTQPPTPTPPRQPSMATGQPQPPAAPRSAQSHSAPRRCAATGSSDSGPNTAAPALGNPGKIHSGSHNIRKSIRNRLATKQPRTCQQYAAVPGITAASIAARIVDVGESTTEPRTLLSNDFAKPKSNTFTTPEAVTKIFHGFKSR
jgi:hypothetical protein